MYVSGLCIITSLSTTVENPGGTWKWIFLERKHLKLVQYYHHWRVKWKMRRLWMTVQEVEGRSDGRQEGGREGRWGGQTQVGVLTIPWVISQLSMGSSWSAGLSSPLTLSWINNRTRPYTREEGQQAPPQHRTQRREAERERERGGGQICKRWLHLKVKEKEEKERINP